LPAGNHTISFLVQDDDGAWSDPVSLALNIQPAEINNPPTAVIEAISPNPAEAGQWVAFSGYGNDSDGVIASYLWSSSLSGPLSFSSSFSSESLPVGAQTISLQVQDDDGAWSVPVTMNLIINSVTSSVEQMYICLGYGNGTSTTDFLENWLQGKGVTKEAGVWKYTSPQGKDFLIHFVQDIAGMRQALTTRGAHVLYRGHSNFGLGTTFATDEEEVSAVIDDIYTIDDPRIFNYSSQWINVNVRRLRTHQAYPNWWPVFQDGTNGIMPYDFDDPAGDPPYNYYITYQIPGDPTRTHHLLQSPNVGSIQRFPDSGRPAWYSADGSKPDPADPDHLQYFITNPETWSPSLHITGDWFSSLDLAGFFRDDYLYLPAGYGRNKVEYLFTTPKTGQYRILAWWPASLANTAGAKYIVNHDGGSSVVSVNQKEDGGQWNEIGVFPFQAGDYSVIISGQAGSGQVVADGIRVVALDNPPPVIQADFSAETRYGPAPLTVSFENASTGNITSYDWDFGDGKTDHVSATTTYSYSSRTFKENTYTTPGTYTVRLTASGPDGTSTKIKTGYIIVGKGGAPLFAEFSGNNRQDNAPLKTTFSDMSSGQIVSWSWDFDDDGIVDSTDQNPSHTYLEPGNYTVSLTVADAVGHSATEKKTNFILARLFDYSLDNVNYPKNHYRSKTILFRKALEVPKSELRYSRLYYDGCNTGTYFLDTFNRGVVFYTVNNSSALGFTAYLKYYLMGKSDQVIWEQMQKRSAVYDYYDFNKLPSKQ
jgi:PKD repeat protein